MLTSLTELDTLAVETISGKGKKIRVLRCLGDGPCLNLVKVSRVPSQGLCQSCAAKNRFSNMLLNGFFWSPAVRIRLYEPTYNVLKKRANRRGIHFNLTYEQFFELYKVPDCHYCGGSLNRKQSTEGYSRKLYTKGSSEYSLDRKDNSKGYTLENCVPCCPKCNFTKRDHLSYGEMVIISEIRKFNKSKEPINANS